MKKLYIITLLLIAGTQLFAQQDAMFTHYMFNTNAVNPAYAGSRNTLSFTALNRSQWLGMEGAPVTQTFNLHSPIGVKNSALGFSVTNDKVGVTKIMGVYADYAYKVQVTKKSFLSFGLKAGFDKLTDNLTQLEVESNTDQSFLSDYESDLMPNFGFGLYYLAPRFYLGASVPRIVNYKYGESDNPNWRGGEQHIFAIAGAVFDLSPGVVFKPTGLMKFTKGAPIEFDATATFILKQKIWLGGMFRSGDAIGALVGINLNPQLSIGYSYDWSFIQLETNNGSHEIMLRYDFIYKNEKILSPRFF